MDEAVTCNSSFDEDDVMQSEFFYFLTFCYFLIRKLVFLVSVPTSSTRFSMVTDIEEFKNSRIPETTQRKVKWIVGTFNTWHEEWKCRVDSILKTYKTIEEMTINELNYTFQYFFAKLMVHYIHLEL